MSDRALTTLAWAWLPALLAVLVLVGTVRWAGAPGGPLGGPAEQRCSASAMASFLQCR